MDNINLLIIEDEEFDVRRIKNTVKVMESSITIQNIVSNGNDALALIQNNPGKYDVIIMDYQIAGGLMGEQLILEVKKIDPILQIMVITKMTIQQTNFYFANQLISAGAFWFCTKYPGDIEEFIYQPTDFILGIVNAYQKKKLEKDKLKSNAKLKKNINVILEKKKIIGESESIEKLRKQIAKYSVTNANVVIHGASGTGKELIATNIHYLSKRKFESFIPINCASLPSDLIESELFGYEKGSFTGASDKRIGYFEQADKGTIFLDEIGEFPLKAQGKLLRVLQEGEIDKIGRKESHKVDVRVIAATNKDLKKLVEERKFREDLFFRLNVLKINVPTLDEHPEDTSILIYHFLKIYSNQMGMVVPEVEDDAKKMLVEYTWPGNVRELQNVTQRMLLLAEDRIDIETVTEAIGTNILKSSDNDLGLKFDKNKIIPLREVEKHVREKYIHFVRKHCKTDAEAASKLDLAPPNFHRICKELGLK